jgi:hypothetical protein
MVLLLQRTDRPSMMHRLDDNTAILLRLDRYPRHRSWHPSTWMVNTQANASLWIQLLRLDRYPRHRSWHPSTWMVNISGNEYLWNRLNRTVSLVLQRTCHYICSTLEVCTTRSSIRCNASQSIASDSCVSQPDASRAERVSSIGRRTLVSERVLQTPTQRRMICE